MLFEIRRVLGDLLQENARDCRSGKRELAREHLISDDPEAVDIGASIDFAIPCGLLRAHVVRRADGDAGGRQRPRPRCRCERFRDAEIGEHGPTAASFEQDVVRFDVAVDDPERMSRAERVGCFHHDTSGFLGWESLAALQARRERFTIYVGHDKVDEPVGTLANGVDWHDMRVRQPCGRFSLAQKPYPNLLTERELRREHLDCHAPLEPLIARVIDNAHAAAADLSFQRKRRAKGLGQPLRQRIVHAVLQSIRGLRFSGNIAGWQHTGRRRTWQHERRFGGTFRNGPAGADVFRGTDAALWMPIMVEKPTLGDSMSDRMTLPVLPLRDAVLFPGVATPIGAGRPATLRAIEAALKQADRKVFAVAQKENVDQVTPGVLYTTGTIARISQVQRNLGGVQLILHGEGRGTAVHYSETNGYLEATVREALDLPSLNDRDPAFVALHREVRERAAELGQKSGLPNEVVQQVLQGVSDPGALSDLVAGHLDIQSSERQQLLETLAVEDRLRRVLVHVQRQNAGVQGQGD